MFDIKGIPLKEKQRITDTLLKWGIVTNQDYGTIAYIKAVLPEMKCESIHLIRHAETLAVAKHEFMSDTSNNCAFTENGIAITRKAAEEMKNYNFDVALFGPIERVINTMKLVMDIPQAFVRFVLLTATNSPSAL